MTNIEISKMSRYEIIRYEDESNLQLIALKSDFDKYIHAAVSYNTRKAYQADLNHFFVWGGTLPSTPEIISHYLASHATTHCPATLNRWLVSINRAHTSQNLPSPRLGFYSIR